MHLLIPFAACHGEPCQQALRALKLPHLERLLSRLTPVRLDTGTDDTLSPPHERALAQALGLSAADGQLPWAAWQVLQSGRGSSNEAWGFITPCHWQVNQAHITMDNPAGLDLQAHESSALLAAMRPYFEEDGITLEYDSPTRWLARGELFRGLATASLDRVVGRDLAPWIPEATPLRRLQNEMQMLLYTHPVNDRRAARGLAPVNSFWVHGSGALHENAVHRATELCHCGLEPQSTTAQENGLDCGLRRNDKPWVTQRLRDAALREDWTAWSQAWQQLDATECAALLAALDQPGPPGRATLTLCGERSAQTFEAVPRGMLTRIAGIFGRKPLSNLCNQL